jgi:hypothetical protein
VAVIDLGQLQMTTDLNKLKTDQIILEAGFAHPEHVLPPFVLLRLQCHL